MLCVCRVFFFLYLPHGSQLFEAVKSNPIVRTLSVGPPRQAPERIDAAAKALASLIMSSSTLQVLRVVHLSLSPSSSALFLTDMKIGFGLSDQNMHAISFSVTQNRTLKEIDFSANAFGDAGLESLCDGANLFFLSYASRYLTIPGIDGCKTITSVRLDKVNCTVKGSVCHHLII